MRRRVSIAIVLIIALIAGATTAVVITRGGDADQASIGRPDLEALIKAGNFNQLQAAITADELNVHLVSSTSTTVKLGWTPLLSGLGYVMTTNGVRVASTFSSSVSSYTFARKSTQSTYGVAPIDRTAGSYIGYPTATGGSNDLGVHVTSSSNGRLTVAWTAFVDGLGYVLTIDGTRVDYSWRSSLAVFTYHKKTGQHTYGVVQVDPALGGTVGFPTPLPPPTTTGTTTATTTTAPTTTGTTTTGPTPTPTAVTTPWTTPSFITYTCGDSFYLDGALVTGTNAGTSWANAWKTVGAVNWGLIGPDDCLYVSGGSTSTTYTTTLSVGSNGTSGHPIKILSGQDSGHNGVAIFNAADINAGAHDYITIDGEGTDATGWHFKIVNSQVITQGSVGATDSNSPVVRYVEGDNGSIQGSGGTGGLYDHLYLHNVGGDSAMHMNGRNFNFNGASGSAYGSTIIQNVHISVDSVASESGCGTDGIQTSVNMTVQYSLLESNNNGYSGCDQHQDLIQMGGAWLSVIGNQFFNSGESDIDIDCFTGQTPNHIRIYNNVAAQNRGLDFVTFYGSNQACNSFDNIHIDNNTIVDKINANEGYGAVAICSSTCRASPVATNSEIKNNIFYNDDAGPGISITGSTGWAVDYNDISGGTGAIVGASQAHPLTCTPTFTSYVLDASPYSPAVTWTSLASNDSLNLTDTCATHAGADLSALFTTDINQVTRTTPWDVGAYKAPS